MRAHVMMDSFPTLLTRVLDSNTYSATAVLLMAKAERLMGNDPKLSPIKANHDAAAIILAEYRRELARLDSALSFVSYHDGKSDILLPLSEKLRELDETKTYSATLIDLSGSRTLLDDSLAVEQRLANLSWTSVTTVVS